MLRIVQLHNSYKEKGGEDTISINDAINLEKNGHEVKKYIKHNLNLNSLVGFVQLILSYLKLNNQEKDIINFIGNKTDIVHIYNYFPQWPTWIFEAINKKKIPIVVSLGNYRIGCINGLLYRKNQICLKCIEKNSFVFPIFNKCYKNNFFISLFAKIYQSKFKRNALKYIDGFIVPHNFSKKIHEKIGLETNKIHIKENFTFFSRSKKYSYNPHSNLVIYVGRLDEYKGINWVIDHWNKLNTTLKLIIIGPAKDYMSGKINEINKNIIVQGEVENKLIFEYLSKAKFMIFPSKMYEAGTPLSLIEGLAAGLPILGSNIKPINEMVVHNKNGLLFELDNFDDFYNKFKKLEKNEVLLNSMSLNSIKIFDDNYSHKKNYNKLINIYNKILNN